MFIPQISISTRKVVYYDYWDGERRRNITSIGGNLRSSSNRISNKSYRRMRLSIQTLVDTARYKTVYVRETDSYFRYKVNFITLTLPSAQLHTDFEIYKSCLKPFLEAWQKRRKGLLYVWKAEVQENGNIHYHVVSNSFYHYKKLRKDWNRYVNALGYVDRCVYDDPNSTDVHALGQNGDVATYLTNYFCKKDLYSKSLKRYHKLHNTKLKSLVGNVFILPRNYLNRLKRSVTGTSYSCSKPLTNCSISLYRNDSTISKDLELLEAMKSKALTTDYSLCYFFDKSIEYQLPQLFKSLSNSLKKLLQIQYNNMVHEEIEAL